MIIMTNNDYNHCEIIQRKRYGGGAKLFRTLLMFLSVSSGIDRCYWPYGQMRLSSWDDSWAYRPIGHSQFCRVSKRLVSRILESTTFQSQNKFTLFEDRPTTFVFAEELRNRKLFKWTMVI